MHTATDKNVESRNINILVSMPASASIIAVVLFILWPFPKNLYSRSWSLSLSKKRKIFVNSYITDRLQP